jgi:hypothetical protein
VAVTLVAVTHFLMGLTLGIRALVFVGFLLSSESTRPREALGQIILLGGLLIGLAVLSLGIAQVASAIGLFARRRWGRLLGLGVSVILILGIPLPGAPLWFHVGTSEIELVLGFTSIAVLWRHSEEVR